MMVVDWLATAGHRLSTGAANASGTVRALQPGTNATASLFDSAGEVLTQPVELDAGGHATVYTDDPVDLAFEDSGGASAGTVPFGNVHGAESVRVENVAFTGLLASGSQGVGGVTYLDTLATRALTSFGGVDWMLKESAGGTARGLAAVIFGIQISVRDFGAKGDGLAVDTSPIQTAINRMSARGGGRVYVDPGTYLIDAQLTLPANVSLIGAGSAVSIIKQTNATANGILVSAAGVGNNLLQGIQVTHSTTSTGIGISCVSTSQIVMRDVTIASAKYKTGVKFDACSSTSVYDCQIACQDPGAGGTGRSLLYATSGTAHLLVGGTLDANTTGTCLELATGTNGFSIFGVNFTSAAIGVLLTSSGVTGLMRVISCTGLSSIANPFVEGSSPHSRALEQIGNGIDGFTVTAVAGTVAITGALSTPLLAGTHITIRATTVGTYTIPALTTNPAQRGFKVVLILWNNAGGAITAWNFNALWHRDATAASLVDGNRTALTFEFDPDVPCMRQISVPAVTA